MNQYPLYGQWLNQIADFNAANLTIAMFSLFVVSLLVIFYLRYPRLMAAARVLLSYSFFIMTVIMLVSGL